MNGESPAQTDPKAADEASLLQVHIAEYNAPTARNVYRVYFMTTLWAMVAVAAAVFAQLTSLNPV